MKYTNKIETNLTIYFCPQASEVAYRKAERALEHERRAVESAEKAAAAAEKKLEK